MYPDYYITFIGIYLGFLDGDVTLLSRFTKNLLLRLRLYLGVSLGFGLISYASYAMGVTMLIAPLAASTCIIFAVPDSVFARPRNIVVGHMLSAAIGVICLGYLGETWVGNAVCVALCVAVMDVTGTMHPPAAATGLLAYTTNQGFDFILSPVALGACVLVFAAHLVKLSLFYHKN